MQYQELWHAKLHVAEEGGETTLSQTVFCLANIWGRTELAFFGGAHLLFVSQFGVWACLIQMIIDLGVTQEF